MAPKVSQEYMAERRFQILDAAVATFSRRGFHQTTIEDIRLEAGLSRGAVYHYFKSKEDIIDGIRERSAQQAADIFTEATGSEDVGSTLERLIDSTMANMVSATSVEANRLAMFLWAESLVNERIRAGQLPAFQPYLEVLAEAVKEAQAVRKLDPELDPQAVARVIAGAMIGLQTQLTWDPSMDIGAAHRTFTSIIMGTFRQPPVS